MTPSSSKPLLILNKHVCIRMGGGVDSEAGAAVWGGGVDSEAGVAVWGGGGWGVDSEAGVAVWGGG